VSKLLRLLVAVSGLSEYDVRTIIVTAPSRYKTYTIPKRSGGERTISQPAREVKFLQRIFLEEVLAKLPVHTAATAYRQGTSIKDNAAAHAGGGAILKLDFKDFFPSIVAADWEKYCKTHLVFDNEDDARLSASLLFSRSKFGSVLRLAIGAPSSPALSNVLMAEFDARVSKAVVKDKVTYTRYADDLTFSARRAGNLVGIERILRRIIRETESPSLRLHEEKTVLATKKFRRVVTGLVLADDGAVSLGRHPTHPRRAIAPPVRHDREIARPAGRTAKPASETDFRKRGFVRKPDCSECHRRGMLADPTHGADARQALGLHCGDGLASWRP
jgi:RNA-directed DNA polymerase